MPMSYFISDQRSPTDLRNGLDIRRVKEADETL